jgi:hypothetical protein
VPEPQRHSFWTDFLSDPLLQYVVGEVTDELANLQRFFFDQPGSLEGFRTELFKLHQLGVRQHHPNSVIQVVKPLPDLVVIHMALD